MAHGMSNEFVPPRLGDGMAIILVAQKRPTTDGEVVVIRFSSADVTVDEKGAAQLYLDQPDARMVRVGNRKMHGFMATLFKLLADETEGKA